MKRPSFQFYPGDWQSDLKLRRCSAAARGVWIDILCALHDSDDGYGLLRWPLKEIASTVGANMAHVRPGKTGEIVWQFTRTGEFQFACLQPGHFEAGMAGKVIVK